ncbi:major facilitator superfamily domain-containing protein [Fusarium redolens]|uniref:Major facilitator superfamily domain-containing protein n=1 Tax=Fusarium redolens TaxID=48865 RepID=A0A9P9FXX0_FUSRE|nr:major facilitator superfamily domain-containing protein [Fusarium redolens]KAH7227087.1 major facilitator superfamily domain-containing protein [Fusarium redolens]
MNRSKSENKMSLDAEELEHAAEHQEQQRVEVPKESNERIKNAFDRRLLPIVCCLYVLSYLDRGNIGNAKTAGAKEDLGLSDSEWAWVLNSFYICYVCFEWTNLFWKVLPASKYVATLCVCWGTAAMCSGAAKNLGGLIATRALLGVFEAGFGAGAPYFLSLFYRRKELGFRVSLLLGMSPLANCFASALAYGITHIRGSMEPWRYLFIIEGAPTVAFSVVAWFFLADSPDKAKYLSEEDATYAVERLQVRDRTKKTGVRWNQIFAGLTDYQNYIHTVIHFCCNYSFAGLSNFLPTIVRDMGYSSVTAQGLTAPPYFLAFICCVLAALIIIVQDESKKATRYAAIFLASCGVFPALCINITWLLNNQGGDSKKGAGLAILATFGQCSSFVSSVVFPSSDGPLYLRGTAIGCGLTGLISILGLGLHFALERENKRRDREYGPVDADMAVDVTELGDKNKNFRYLT